MNWTNALGTITAALTVVMGIMTGLGCAPGAVDFAATCNIPWLPEQWLPYAAMLTGAIAFGLKLLRPGGVLRSLFGSTAVVVPAAKVADLPNGAKGVVTPAQVASEKT